MVVTSNVAITCVQTCNIWSKGKHIPMSPPKTTFKNIAHKHERVDAEWSKTKRERKKRWRVKGGDHVMPMHMYAVI